MDNEKLRLYLARRIRGLLSGQYASSQLRPRGHDMEERRQFRLGDDPRAISFLATAKRNDKKPHVSIHKIEKGVNIVFLIDSSASTRFGTLIGKYKYAAKLTERIALACLGEGNRFRFLAFDDRVRHDSGYKLTENEIKETLDALLALPTAKCKTSIKNALEYVEDVASGFSNDFPGIVFIVSDFIFGADFEHQLASVYESSDAVALLLRDPAELELPKPRFGLVELTDPETGKQFWVRSADNPLDKMRPILKRCEVDWLEIQTAENQGSVLEKLAELFERREED